MNFTQLFRRMTLGLVLAIVPMLGGCGDVDGRGEAIGWAGDYGDAEAAI